MSASVRKATTAKAFFAIACASSLLGAQQPAIAEWESGPSISAIERIATSPKATPEFRAFSLLELAEGYLSSDDKSVVEEHFSHFGGQLNSLQFAIHFRMEDSLVSWANRLASEDKPLQKAPKPYGSNNVVLANSAIEQALKQLDKTANQFEKLNMYFIASLLFKRAGNVAEVQKYNTFLEQAFQSCEKNPFPAEPQTKAVSAVLNSMAYGVIQVSLPYRNPETTVAAQRASIPSFTPEDFDKSEALKLRAEAMADRLLSKADTRRRIHRDLSLWYAQLGKAEKAEQQKQILFELVGCKDDKILYPVQAGCGGFVWWGDESRMMFGACGMG